MLRFIALCCALLEQVRVGALEHLHVLEDPYEWVVGETITQRPGRGASCAPLCLVDVIIAEQLAARKPAPEWPSKLCGYVTCEESQDRRQK